KVFAKTGVESTEPHKTRARNSLFMKFSPPQRPLASWPHSDQPSSLDKTPDNCGDLWEGHGKLLGTRGTKYEKRATLGAERLKTRHCGDVSPSNLADIAKNRFRDRINGFAADWRAAGLPRPSRDRRPADTIFWRSQCRV